MRELIVLCCGIVLSLCALTRADEPAKPDKTPEQLEAEYTATITKRSADLVEKLQLNDAAKSSAVRELVIANYRNLRAWHDANDAKIKALGKANTEESKAQIAEIRATLKPTHDKFLSDLGAHLTSEQVDKVKDLLTYNVRNVTYDAYVDMIPKLTDTQKAQIMTWLTEAREIAMDEGSSKDKHAVFGKYKGRINNYLSKEGYDQRAEEAAWRERLKARRAAASQKAD